MEFFYLNRSFGRLRMTLLVWFGDAQSCGFGGIEPPTVQGAKKFGIAYGDGI
jgi:hypothetical protein